MSQTAKTGFDLWLVPMTGKPTPFLATPANESLASFSPDGRFVAYVSDESGTNEFYVTSFPGPGGKWQISSGGAEFGGWLGDGREVSYWTEEGKAFAVPVRAIGPVLEVGAPRPLFGAKALRVVTGALTADGKRFLAAVPVEGDASVALTLVTNWAAGLEER